MDSEHVMYKHFAEMMAESFYDFLCKLQKSDCHIIDCQFMGKLKDIDQVLRELFKKDGLPTLEKGGANQVPTCSQSIPPVIENDEKFSTGSDKKRKSIDSSYINPGHDGLFERMRKFMSRDIEGSDDSDCEMKSVEVSSEDLFKTDYPDECFEEITRKAELVSCHDVSSSLNKSVITSIEDDPFIRKLRPVESTYPEKMTVEVCDDLEEKYPYIHKVNEDVYMCKSCLINNLPKNNVIPHVNGRQHKTAVKKLKDVKLKPNEEIETSLKISKTEDGSPPPVSYECTLCKTTITCRENVLQHLNGKQHNRKLENA